jgi:membrane protease subunit HflK
VTDTPFARARRAALLGLALQVIAAVTCVVLAVTMRSLALDGLAAMLACGVPIWFIALLVYRQHELAALEALDLEELRREKRATGGGEALFDEQGGGGIGFLVAKNRLEWMQRWLVPVFALVVGAALLSAAAWGWWRIYAFTTRLHAQNDDWPAVQGVEFGLIIVAVITLLVFLISRYASGLARHSDSKLLRACGSYGYGVAIVGFAILVAFGAQIYQRVYSWEHYVAWAIPIIMGVLGLETLLNFIFDIYRPRSPGTEPRAAFDSRLLGLLAEPGGIAHGLAEAMNYQFGFQVSQTWFYQLLQRTLIPLVLVAAVAIWLLTTIIVVDPNERAIVERWGEQIAPDQPLGPGFHLKAPWPIEVAYKYDTGRLHQFALGYKVGDTPLDEQDGKPIDHSKPIVEQWSDAKHAGREHFNFVVPPPSNLDGIRVPGVPGTDKRAPVNIIRMEVFVQYRIDAARLIDFTRANSDPHLAVRDVAWDEIGRLSAALSVDELMNNPREKLMAGLFDRVVKRCDELRLGLKIDYVGLTNIHPDSNAATAFRKVVTARQEKITEIRKARVDEAKILAEVAGDKQKSIILAHAIQQTQDNELRMSQARRIREDVDAKLPESLQEKLAAATPLLNALFEAQWADFRARDELALIKSEFDIGMGRSPSEIEIAAKKRTDTETAEKTAADALESGLAPIRSELVKTIEPMAADAYLTVRRAESAVAFWNGVIEKTLVGLEGQAAVELAQAQAKRWVSEMRAASELTKLEIEREGFAANPKVYKARRYLEVLTSGLKKSRKYFLAFDPAGRTVHTRLQMEEKLRPDQLNMATREKQN